MADYRFYFLDRRGHVRQAVDAVCDDDDEAIIAVEKCRQTDAMELWSGTRVVKKFPARQHAD